MTQFMLAHPWLFTFQVAFVCLAVASLGVSKSGSVRDVHHHYPMQGGQKNAD